jgi:hypothetical protein
MDSNIIRALCICDTIHDFGKELRENTFYIKFMEDQTVVDYVRGFVGAEPKDIISSVEKQVMTRLNIFDDKNDDANAVMYDKLTVENINANRNPQLFTIITDDVNDPKFTHLLAGITATGAAAATNLGDIRYNTDSTILSYQTICDIKMSSSKKAQLVISEATDYDRGTVQGEGQGSTDCVNRSYIPAKLDSSDGNLFGLDTISVYSDASLRRFIHYEFTHNNVKYSSNIDIAEFIDAQIGMETRNLGLFTEIIKGLYAGTVAAAGTRGGGQKRKTTEDGAQSAPAKSKKKKKASLFDLLNDLKRVYHLDHNVFQIFRSGNKINTQNCDQFIRILFDLKRAGDQLQVMSAKMNNLQSNSKITFISNDRMSLSYAFLLGLPCIKTAKIKSDDNTKKTRNRKITFYNYNKEAVKTNVIENKGYYIDLIDENLEIYELYISQIVQLRNRFVNYPFVGAINKIKKCISTSVFWLNLNEMALQQAKIVGMLPVFIYKYVHVFNIWLHSILLKVLIDMLKASELESKKNELQQEFAPLKAANIQGNLNLVNIDDIKRLVAKCDDIINFSGFMHLSHTDNNNFVVDLLNIYANGGIDLPNILYSDIGYLFDDAAEAADAPDVLIFKTDNAVWLMQEKKKDDLHKQNTRIFNDHINAIKSTFIDKFRGQYLSRLKKLPLIYKLIEFFDEWYSHSDHNLSATRRVSKDPNLRLRFMDGQNRGIYVKADVDYDLLKLKKAEKAVKNALLEYDKLIDILANDINSVTIDNVIINVNINDARNFKMYYYGGQSGKSSKSGIINKVIREAAKIPEAPVKDITYFLKQLDEIYNTKDDIDELTKFLIIFFAKMHNMFDDEGNLTDRYLELLSREGTVSHRRSYPESHNKLNGIALLGSESKKSNKLNRVTVLGSESKRGSKPGSKQGSKHSSKHSTKSDAKKSTSSVLSQRSTAERKSSHKVKSKYGSI